MTLIIPDAVTILNGQSVSNSVPLDYREWLGFVMPSGWTAAGITFQASIDNGATWVDAYDENGSEITFTVGASRYVLFSQPVKFFGSKLVRLRSGTSGTPVNQGADRVIRILLEIRA
jgi:hypothetical protein